MGEREREREYGGAHGCAGSSKDKKVPGFPAQLKRQILREREREKGERQGHVSFPPLPPTSSLQTLLRNLQLLS